MTISKGENWGEQVDRPPDLRMANGDRELAGLLADGSGRATSVSGGDVFRTVGSRPLADRTEMLALPIDLMRVVLDDGEPIHAVAHVLVRSPWWFGGWWRGKVLAVMNAEFIGQFDIAPRGHPNDGRVETFRAGAEMSFRQRWEVRRRLPSARHLPHPSIASRSVRSGAWEFDRSSVVVIDGERVGVARRLELTVIPDAATLYV